MLDIFTKFRETEFLNESTRVEEQIEELKSIREQIQDTSNIDRDIKLLEAGLKGEKNILYELKNANIGMYVLSDITLKYEDLTAQIDFVVVTKGPVYLIECKNMIGNVTVNSSGEFKREYTLNGQKIKEAMFSPLAQARRHKEVLKKIWIKKHSALTTFFMENTFDKVYKPLVVLANSKSLLNTKYAPKDVKKSTVRLDNLIEYIKNDIKKYDSSLYASKKEMLSLANTFLENDGNCNNPFVEKYKNFRKVDEPSDKTVIPSRDRVSIENKLKSFRKEKSNKMGVPAYYVFTNEELDNILELMPSSIEELKNSKILSGVKLKCHGEEIVKIINS